jgi:hypothetical protein
MHVSRSTPIPRRLSRVAFGDVLAVPCGVLNVRSDVPDLVRDEAIQEATPSRAPTANTVGQDRADGASPMSVGGRRTFGGLTQFEFRAEPLARKPVISKTRRDCPSGLRSTLEKRFWRRSPSGSDTLPCAIGSTICTSKMFLGVARCSSVFVVDSRLTLHSFYTVSASN